MIPVEKYSDITMDLQCYQIDPDYSDTLILSALRIKPDTSANNVDPDETAHYEPSHQVLHFAVMF